MMKKIGNFLKNDDGQGMVEYALILSLIAIVAIAALSFVGQETKDLFSKVGDALNSGNSSAGVCKNPGGLDTCN